MCTRVNFMDASIRVPQPPMAKKSNALSSIASGPLPSKKHR